MRVSLRQHLACAFSCLLMFGAALAQQPKVRVLVAWSGSDQQGAEFVRTLKTTLVESKPYALVNERADSSVQILLTSIDPTDARTQTVYRVAITVTDPRRPGGFPLYIDSTVGLCGYRRIPECVSILIARLDKDLLALGSAPSAPNP